MARYWDRDGRPLAKGTFDFLARQLSYQQVAVTRIEPAGIQEPHLVCTWWMGQDLSEGTAPDGPMLFETCVYTSGGWTLPAKQLERVISRNEDAARRTHDETVARIAAGLTEPSIEGMPAVPARPRGGWNIPKPPRKPFRDRPHHWDRDGKPIDSLTRACLFGCLTYQMVARSFVYCATDANANYCVSTVWDGIGVGLFSFDRAPDIFLTGTLYLTDPDREQLRRGEYRLPPPGEFMVVDERRGFTERQARIIHDETVTALMATMVEPKVIDQPTGPPAGPPGGWAIQRAARAGAKA